MSAMDVVGELVDDPPSSVSLSEPAAEGVSDTSVASADSSRLVPVSLNDDEPSGGVAAEPSQQYDVTDERSLDTKRPPALKLTSGGEKSQTPLVRAMVRGLKEEATRKNSSGTFGSSGGESPGPEGHTREEQAGVADSGIWGTQGGSRVEINTPSPLHEQPMSPSSEEQAADDLRCVTYVFSCSQHSERVPALSPLFITSAEPKAACALRETQQCA